MQNMQTPKPQTLAAHRLAGPAQSKQEQRVFVQGGETKSPKARGRVFASDFEYPYPPTVFASGAVEKGCAATSFGGMVTGRMVIVAEGGTRGE